MRRSVERDDGLARPGTHLRELRGEIRAVERAIAALGSVSSSPKPPAARRPAAKAPAPTQAQRERKTQTKRKKVVRRRSGQYAERRRRNPKTDAEVVRSGVVTAADVRLTAAQSRLVEALPMTRPLSKQVLVKALSSTPSAVGRTAGVLAGKGVVTITGDDVALSDLGRKLHS